MWMVRSKSVPAGRLNSGSCIITSKLVWMAVLVTIFVADQQGQ